MKSAIFLLCLVASLVMILASLVHESTFMFIGATLMVATFGVLLSNELKHINN
jgi:hypothetical protein